MAKLLQFTVFLNQFHQEMLDRFNVIANITFNLNDDKQAPSINCKYYTINELNSKKCNTNTNFYAI